MYSQPAVVTDYEFLYIWDDDLSVQVCLAAVCCLLPAVCCLSSAVCCLSSAVCCLLSPAVVTDYEHIFVWNDDFSIQVATIVSVY
jgi:hypothetical protein